jgi:hypothetical protein
MPATAMKPGNGRLTMAILPETNQAYVIRTGEKVKGDRKSLCEGSRVTAILASVKDIVVSISELLRWLGSDLARRAFLEVMVHIAFDADRVHLGDVRLMSEYTRTLSGILR